MPPCHVSPFSSSPERPEAPRLNLPVAGKEYSNGLQYVDLNVWRIEGLLLNLKDLI